MEQLARRFEPLVLRDAARAFSIVTAQQGVAQTAERGLWELEVAGSIPAALTCSKHLPPLAERWLRGSAGADVRSAPHAGCVNGRHNIPPEGKPANRPLRGVTGPAFASSGSAEMGELLGTIW